MNLHEHQAKDLLRSYHVPVPAGYVVTEALSPQKDGQAAAQEAVAALGGSLWVVKAQIHAGGRGKAGGVKLAHTPEEVAQHVTTLLGSTLVTHQTGPQGQRVSRVYIEEGCLIQREFYLSFVVDRARCAVGLIASTQGGMDIEEVAATMPEKIIRLSLPLTAGLQPFHGRWLAQGLGLTPEQTRALWPVVQQGFALFTQKDASLLEINPLVWTGSGFLALDAKITLDDNALFRHGDLLALADTSAEDPAEVKARAKNLNYIKLEGNIGCLVNGAGLAMATMDIIKLHGASPANFLDVGGGATQEMVTQALEIIMEEPSVQGILINVFGGIMRCDTIAQGIIVAAQSLELRVPVVVRLAGTKVQEAMALLQASQLPLYTATTLGEAAEKIVSLVKEKGKE